MVNLNTALAMVKARLNRVEGDHTLDAYLSQRIEAAAGEIAGTGIALDDSVEDLMLVVDLAVFEYGSRDKNVGMPDWFRVRLRNRWLRQGTAQE